MNAETVVEQSNQISDAVEWQNALVCKACRMTITHPQFLISKNARTEHLQINPMGFTFIFRTYCRSVGIYVTGEPCTEFSWFKNYAWQFAHCQGCGSHLGWQFVGNDVFFGLLVDKLTVK